MEYNLQDSRPPLSIQTFLHFLVLDKYYFEKSAECGMHMGVQAQAPLRFVGLGWILTF